MSASPQPIDDQDRPQPRDLQPLHGVTVQRLSGSLDCASPKIAYIYDWWRQAAAGGVPDWSQFDVTEHSQVVAYMFLVKRSAPRSWAYTVRGEAIHALFPSFKGANTLEPAGFPDVAHALIGYYEDVSAKGACFLVRGTIVNERGEHVDIESIDCPFYDGTQGRNVILGVAERIATRRPLSI